MIPISLFITSIFAISFSYGNLNTFQRNARINYAIYRETQNEFEYDKRFVDNLYNYDYINESTTITVLTHGLYGDKNYWFPKTSSGTTDYFSNESLAYKIISNQQYDLSNIPILVFEPVVDEQNKQQDVNIYQLQRQTNGNYIFQTFEFNSSNKFLFNKHVVLIYQDSERINKGQITNSEAASYFCDSLDSVLSKISVFYQGNLPKINLIGHSRGGILNLYYAFKRQKMVDNFITIGTPLNGSLWANPYNSLLKLLNFFAPNNENYKDNFDGLLAYENIYNHEQMLASLVYPHVVTIGAEMTPSVFCTEILYELGLINSTQINEITFGNSNIISSICSLITQNLLANNNFLMSTINT